MWTVATVRECRRALTAWSRRAESSIGSPTRSSRSRRVRRSADRAAAGWYSGDVHIHSPRRDAADERAMQIQAQAEDLNVANLLQMGNIATAHFPQRGWGPNGGRVVDLQHALVSGQEDPRTGHRGHTIDRQLA